MNVIILLGAPGSGKGTIGEKIRDIAGYTHISTGDMLRENVKAQTALGLEAESYMKKGELVPDQLIIKIVEARLDKGGQEGSYMFDGFPRTVEQADLLDKSLISRGGGIQHVLFLDSPRDVLMQRLTGRRVCRKCGQSFHIVNIPPKKAGICDLCSGELYQRPDDSEATINNRLEVFKKQTQSLIERYKKSGVLVTIDSNQNAARLSEKIIEYLKKGGKIGATAELFFCVK